VEAPEEVGGVLPPPRHQVRQHRLQPRPCTIIVIIIIIIIIIVVVVVVVVVIIIIIIIIIRTFE
jgi:hypothetical protein